MILKAKRLDLIEPSPTLAITAKAKELKSQGRDIISFGAGEPDFDTPDEIKKAAEVAIQSGKTKYTPVEGTQSIKDAIIEKFKKENKLTYERKNIIVSTGGKQVLYNFFLATLNPGDEVIIPAPYWVSYVDIVRLAEGNPIVIKTKREENFLLNPEKLQKAITKNTKVLILNSPSNPTGSAFPKQLLEKIGEICLKNKILILSDDIYEKIIYDGFPFYNTAMLSKELQELTFVVNGVSKTYSMTGWRIGYGAGNPEIIQNMTTIQSQSTSNPSSISQAAAENALKGGSEDVVQKMVQAFYVRRNLILQLLRTSKHIQCNTPEGAFYVFPYVNSIYNSKKFLEIAKKTHELSKSKVFCSHLLDHYDVAVVPGIAFGDDDAIRLSYAMSEEEIEKGTMRIVKMLADLSD